jgi:predicted Zn-dependent protease
MKSRYFFPFLAITLCIASSFSQEQWIFKAMNDEMGRTLTNLKIDTLKPPYYVSYKVVDGELHSIRASLGSLISVSNTPRSRSLNVQIRVGSRTFDNSNFISYGIYGSSGVVYVSDEGTRSTTYESDYDALRRDLWMASDAVYKRALAELSKKKAVLENIIRTDTTADFSPARPFTTSVEPVQIAFDGEWWKERAKKLSAMLKTYPEIQSSDVYVGARTEYVYFLNSEGSRNTHGKTRVWIEVKAKTQAPDGMSLVNYVTFYGDTKGDLPTEQEMMSGIDKMAHDLMALRTAPVLDEYSGPVLFEQQAAGELVSQGLGSNVSYLRDPIADNPQLDQQIHSLLGELPFQNKVGARVLPKFLSVVDAPTQSRYKGMPLLGLYTVDEEGVPAQDVKVVDKGFLKTLLMSRTPHKRIPESNGHGRTDPSQAFFSNLIVTTSQPTNDADMKNKLIGLCKEVGLDYGLIIRKINNPYLKQSLRESTDPSSPTRSFMTEPILAYKLFLNGKEELVRGMEFSGMTAQSFKDIVAASQTSYVYNHITKQKKTTLSGLYSGTDVRVSVVTPSLLFESVDLKKASQQSRNLPIASRPAFGNQK